MSITIIDTNYLNLLKTYKSVKKAEVSDDIKLFENLIEGLEYSLNKNIDSGLIMINLKSVMRTGTDIKILVDDIHKKGRKLPSIIFYQHEINKSAIDKAWNLKAIGQLLPGKITKDKLLKVINSLQQPCKEVPAL